jgi:ABC-type branched-subunit amino acid transport system substrate-binding protein
MNMKKESSSKEEKGLISRRDFIKTIGIGGGALAAGLSGPFFHARAAQPEIRIGHATNLSGVFAVGGALLDKGLKLAFSTSSYKDRVKFFLEDSQTKADVAVQKALKLYEKDQVHILMGPIGGHESAAISAEPTRTSWGKIAVPTRSCSDTRPTT